MKNKIDKSVLIVAIIVIGIVVLAFIGMKSGTSQNTITAN